MARRSKKPDSQKAVIISVSLPRDLCDHFYKHLEPKQTTSSVIREMIKKFIISKEGNQSRLFDPKTIWKCSKCEKHFIKPASQCAYDLTKKKRNICFNKHCDSRQILLIGIDGDNFFDLDEYIKENGLYES